MKDYISTKEAAAIMGISDSMVRRMAAKGKLGAIKISWAYLIKRSAAQAWTPKRKRKESPNN